MALRPMLRLAAIAAGIIAAVYTTGATTAGRQRDIDPASLMTTPVLLMQSGRAVSQGTGFLFGSTDA